MRKVVEIRVEGFEACPWSVPTVGSGTRSDGSRYRRAFYAKKSRRDKGVLNLKDWQAEVGDAARKAMEGISLQIGPIKIHTEFYADTPKGKKHGQLWTVNVRWNPEANKGEGAWVKDNARGRTEPDVLNLSKGTEDALEGIVFGNDVQVRVRSESAFFAEIPGCKVTVYAIEDGDFPGSGGRVR